MSIEGVLMILLWLVILFALAWVAKYIIDAFFPEPIRMPALLLVGVVLLIVVIMMIVRGVPGLPSLR